MAKATKETKPKKSIFTLNESNRKKLRVISATTERNMQDIVNEALEVWIATYEKKNGKILIK